MTAWLNGWLRDIVLVILVATFVDLLIPSNSLGRYVKVVVSLIILLTILTPIISFLKEDKAINQALEQASGNKDGSQALHLILANGAILKSENEHNSRLLAEQQVGKVIKDNLENSLKLQVQDVFVTIKEEEGVNPSIEHIQVIARSKADSESDDEASEGERDVSVDTVSPVYVKVSMDNNAEGKWATDNNQDERSPAQLKMEKQVIRQLAEQWGLADKRIQVEWR